MKRLLIGLGAACVLALGLAGLILTVRQQRQVAVVRQLAADGPANLAREQAAARQAGMALGPEQMQLPLPPAGQNAAPLYTKLAALLKQKPLGLPKYAEGMDAFHAYTPAQIALVRQTLAARQDVMTLIHQAADRPKCVFARDWNLGADLQFPEYSPMREAARLLKAESYLLARDGHYAEAIVNQTRGFRVSEHAASDPVLIPYLVGIACNSLTLSGMQSILAIAGPNAAVAADVRDAVATKGTHLSLRRALAGETGFMSTYILKMHQGESQGISAALVAGGFPDETAYKVKMTGTEQHLLHNLIDAWEADYLAYMRLMVIASDLPPSERRAAAVGVDRKVDLDMQDTSNLKHFLTAILMPHLSNMNDTNTRDQARQAVTQASAFLLGEKAKTSVYPDALPQEFRDPFTNKPLGYRREGTDGFVVYSAGPTGKFDGGKAGEIVPTGESVFRYPIQSIPVPLDMLK